MRDIESDIVAYLGAYNLYPDVLPHKPTYPAVRYVLIGQAKDACLKNEDVGRIKELYQFDVFSYQQLEAEQVLCDIVDSLYAWSDNVVCMPQEGREHNPTLDDFNELPIYRFSQDVWITYEDV